VAVVTCHCGDTTNININFPGVEEIRAQLQRMEQLMAREAVVLEAILGKVNDVFADVRALLAQERAELSDEGQAKADELLAAIDAFDAEIGDADGSDTPAEPEAPVEE
jgi:hypothetical protein